MEVEILERGSVRNHLANWSRNGIYRADQVPKSGRSMQLRIVHDLTSKVGKLDEYLAGLHENQRAQLRPSFKRMLNALYTHQRKGKAQRRHWTPKKRVKAIETWVLENVYPHSVGETVLVPSDATLEYTVTFTADQKAG